MCFGYYWNLVALSSNHIEERHSNHYLGACDSKSYIPRYSLFYVRVLSDFLDCANSEATFLFLLKFMRIAYQETFIL